MDPGMGFFSLPAAAGVAPPPSMQQQQQVVPYGVEIPSRVFVGGCPYNMTELELGQFFSQFGEVRDTKIITDREEGKSKGYGFVTFSREEDAVKVYSQGSIYYKQKKLNVSKAVRKYGGQYKKANQEYVDGQRMVWMHPNGYLLSPHEGGWNIEQVSSRSPPVKLCYSFLPPGQPHPPPPPPYHALYYPHQHYHAGTNMWVGLGQTPDHSQQVCTYPMPPHCTQVSNTSPISTISTITSSGNESLESSGSSLSSSHPPHPHPPTASREAKKKYDIDVKALEEKTNLLSLDSAYTSDVDLDTSHSSTATNSGATSPKLADRKEKAEEKEKSMEEEEEERGEESRSTSQQQSAKKEVVPSSVSSSANTAAFSPSANSTTFSPSANTTFSPSANTTFSPSANTAAFSPDNTEALSPSANTAAFSPSANTATFSPSANTAAFSPPLPLMEPSVERQHYQQWQTDPHSHPHYSTASLSSPMSRLATDQGLGCGYSTATLQAPPPKLLTLVSSPMATTPHLL